MHKCPKCGYLYEDEPFPPFPPPKPYTHWARVRDYRKLRFDGDAGLLDGMEKLIGKVIAVYKVQVSKPPSRFRGKAISSDGISHFNGYFFDEPWLDFENISSPAAQPGGTRRIRPRKTATPT